MCVHAAAKSLVLRVMNGQPWTSAVARISASRELRDENHSSEIPKATATLSSSSDGKFWFHTDKVLSLSVSNRS